MTKHLTTLALAAALGLTCTTRSFAEDAQSGAASDRTADRSTQSGAQDRSQGQQAGARSDRSESHQSMDQKFARMAANGGMFEVQAGKLAEQQSSDNNVKQLAQRIVEDHTKANQQLMEWAQSKGMQIPQKLNEVHQAMLNHLQKENGRDFDRAFTYGNVADHTKMLLMFRDAVQECQDPQLKEWAAQQIPILKQHLQEARRIADADEATTAGAHIRGHDHSSGSGTDRSSDRSTDSGAGSNQSDTPRPQGTQSR